MARRVGKEVKLEIFTRGIYRGSDSHGWEDKKVEGSRLLLVLGDQRFEISASDEGQLDIRCLEGWLRIEPNSSNRVFLQQWKYAQELEQRKARTTADGTQGMRRGVR